MALGDGGSSCRRLSPRAGASVFALAPFPLPAHQTGRADFRHPAFRLASPQGTQRTTFNADAVRQHPGRDSLRPAIQLPPMPPDLNGADRHTPVTDPWLLQKRTRSQGPLLRRHYPASSCRRHAPHVRSYDPVRLPPGPPSETTLRTLPSPMTGLPRLPASPFRRAVPTTPADRMGAHVDGFPIHAAFPK